MMGYFWILIGLLLCFTIVGIPIGLPLIIKGRNMVARKVIAGGVAQGIAKARKEKEMEETKRY